MPSHQYPRAMAERRVSKQAWRIGFVLLGLSLVMLGAPRFVLPARHPVLRADREASQLPRLERPPDLGQWAFVRKQGSIPVSYDPCRTIHYVLRVGQGPLNGANLVREGIARLSAATGFTFVFDGLSDEVPQWATLRDPDRPVFIGWADRTETDIWEHQADAAGVGGSETVLNGRGQEVFATGFVVMKPDNRLPPTFGAGETGGTVLLHELGHVVGLDHVSDDREVMHGGITHFTGEGYGPGDLRGLWELGASRGCR